MVNDYVINIDCCLATGALVPSVYTFFYAFVAEAVATRSDRCRTHCRHTYWTLKVLVHGGYLKLFAEVVGFYWNERYLFSRGSRGSFLRGFLAEGLPDLQCSVAQDPNYLFHLQPSFSKAILAQRLDSRRAETSTV